MGQHLTNEEGEQVDIDAAELQEWYKKFVVECPSGTLFMHEFKQFFGVQNNQEAGNYVENMFKAFDKNGLRESLERLLFLDNQALNWSNCNCSVESVSLGAITGYNQMAVKDNTIDFLEYVAALNLVLRGKLEHKLRWTFKMYDKDGNGCIDKTELLEIVECIYKLKKVCQPEEETGRPRLTPEEVVDRIFQLVDENGDGQLSLDEFLDGARKDKWVMKMLHVDMNAGVWISEQRRKSAMF